jgi:hypothetical protein
MNDDQRLTAFHSALVTEHFVLQSAASSTIAEGSSRASLYFVTLSSSLVALGFATGASSEVLAIFAFTALPTVVIVGWFTIVRLTDTNIENVMCLRSIAHIRGYYSTLDPEERDYFPSTGDVARDAQRMLGLRYTRSTLWFTMASMVGVVNAVVGGAIIVLLLGLGLRAPLQFAVAVGIVVAVASAGACVCHQRRRLARTAASDWGW